MCGGGGTVTIDPGLVLIGPSPLSFLDLLTPEQAHPQKGHQVPFPQGKCQGHLQIQPVHPVVWPSGQPQIPSSRSWLRQRVRGSFTEGVVVPIGFAGRQDCQKNSCKGRKVDAEGGDDWVAIRERGRFYLLQRSETLCCTCSYWLFIYLCICSSVSGDRSLAGSVSLYFITCYCGTLCAQFLLQKHS